MVTRTTTYDYEQSSEGGRERELLIPWTRLTDTTPTLHDPAQVTGRVIGQSITGTIITVGSAADPYVVLNTADGAVYRHNVRNVLTWNAGPVEGTHGELNIGDPVYYDPQSDAINGVKLSTAPVEFGGALNTLFGHIVMMEDEDSSDFPKGADTVGSTHVCAIMQV